MVFAGGGPSYSELKEMDLSEFYEAREARKMWDEAKQERMEADWQKMKHRR